MQPTRILSLLLAPMACAVSLSTSRVVGQSEWQTYQANAARDGYVALDLDAAKLRLDWTVDFGPRELHQVAIANAQVFVAGGDKRLRALDSATGVVQWSHSYTAAFHVNPPCFAAGRVYAQINNSSDSWVRSYQAESGAILSESQHDNQSAMYYAPAIFDGSIYVGGGTFGGMYSFDADTGARRWFEPLAQIDRWTPAVDKDHAYAFLRGLLVALNRRTGATAFTIRDPDFSFRSPMDTSPVLGGRDDVFVREYTHVVRFDLTNRDIHYTLKGDFGGQPAVRAGVLYVLQGGALEARDQHDGGLLWSWRHPTQAMTREIAVTDTHVLLGSSTHTCLVNLTTHREVWSVAEGGFRAIGQGAVYIASDAGRLSCYRFADLPRPDSVSPPGQHFARPLTPVTIKGAAFSGTVRPSVAFGTSMATNVVVVDDKTITCTPPVSGPGQVDVTVANRIGARQLRGGFTYLPAVIATGDHRLGGAVELRVECETGADLMLAIGLPTSPFVVPPFRGALGLREILPMVFAARVFSGKHSLRLAVPRLSRLRGGVTGFQALVSPGYATRNVGPHAFTNLATVEIR